MTSKDDPLRIFDKCGSASPRTVFIAVGLYAGTRLCPKCLEGRDEMAALEKVIVRPDHVQNAPHGVTGPMVSTTGMEHSCTSATGTGWERTPWHATQWAAWEALRNAEESNR